MDSIKEAIRQLREKRKNHVMTSKDYATGGEYGSPAWDMSLMGACPHCKENDIEVKEQRFELVAITMGILPVSCRSCGAAWDMRFILDGFEWEGNDGKYDIEEEG
jgi:hypothetical protein